MHENSPIIWILALATLVIVLGYGIWQRAKAAKAKANKEHTALTEGHPEQRRSDGAPGVKPQ